MRLARALVATLASASAFYFSIALGSVWPLAWLAPIPVLWLAFGPAPAWQAFVAAAIALAVGASNILAAYLGILPPAVLLVAIGLPACAFAVSVLGARFVARRVSPLAGAVTFAALWTSCDYLMSFGPNGSAASPAYSQVGMPFLIQSAAVFGLWSITFLLGAFAAGIAAALATRQRAPAILALVLVLADAGYGTWRIETAPGTAVVRIGLAGDSGLIPTGLQASEAAALKVSDSYAAAARSLAMDGASLTVFPEKILVTTPKSFGAVEADFETAAHIGHETIVAGMDQRGRERRNNAVIFFANGTPPLTYTKRRLVPGLEDAFAPGSGSFMLSDHTGVEICKDMDFPRMVRRDSMLHPTLVAVPAWDFGADGWWHARLAILRGVENGFAVARAANDGLLTLSDAYGRVLARRPTDTGDMVTLSADVARGPGRTPYSTVGDSFAWFCLGLSIAFTALAASVRKPR